MSSTVAPPEDPLEDPAEELGEDLAEDLSPAQLIDVITETERQIRALAARQVQATARYDTLLRGRAGGDGATAREIALA
ncbi:hypothetical protein, partial [Kineococcus sp. NPDC059986]|uniref:hypothetical protein n=1 Tax=Kineococcus sp. NPDC059986 TaxID=3155538 RepID=UPI00344C71DC